MDIIIKLKQSGIITAQKANDLLPEEFQEKLPEMPEFPVMGQTGKVPQAGMAKEPNPPLDRIRSGKEKRNPKKVERKNGSV